MYGLKFECNAMLTTLLFHAYDMCMLRVKGHLILRAALGQFYGNVLSV